jgi:tetratricopeptide (TPR) repeat protein
MDLIKSSTDPTYLRSIRDGLISGTLHIDKAAPLPFGLSGIYEESLPASNHPAERQRFLEFFGVWALLKKEVSAEFVATILEGWTELKVLDEITRNSKWFNVLAGGRYALYHERLRSFLQQRISENQFSAMNDAIIVACRQALEEKKGDDWEFYALEHLSSHLLLPAMETGHCLDLKTLAYDTSHWNRQIEISKDFEWSRRMLGDMMLWASKYDDEEVIECALNQVDLHHLEQNDAPRIVELVKQNDIKTALHRIEAFGGNDQKGLQRKFLLYMLCLMELTLLESKDLPHRKDAIEKLLKHLDENLPEDHSVLNWNNFFASYVMFMMACVWAELELDYLMVYKRTDIWDTGWLNAKGLYSELQLEVIKECALGINDEFNKSKALSVVSIELANQGKVVEALACARAINPEFDTSTALKRLSIELAKKGEVTEALTCVHDISDESDKNRALQAISSELAKQGKIEESFECARAITDEFDKGNAVKCISIELAKQGKIAESLARTRGISDKRLVSIALKEISSVQVKLELVKEAEAVRHEAVECARAINDDFWKSMVLKAIQVEFAKHGNAEEATSLMQEALACIRRIGSEKEKNHALKDISIELARQGQTEEALDCARSIREVSEKNHALKNISTELAKLGLIEEALACVLNISYDLEKSRAFINISTELTSLGQMEEAALIMQKAIECALYIKDDFFQSTILLEISTELAKEGKTEDAIQCTLIISDEIFKSMALKDISTELAKKGQVGEAASVMHQALACSHDFSGESRDRLLMNLTEELAKQGNKETAETCAKAISNKRFKSLAQKEISAQLAKHSKFEEAMEFTSGKMDAVGRKNINLIELAKQGKLKEAIELARGIKYEKDKSMVLKDISTELAKQGRFDEALECACIIPDDSEKRHLRPSLDDGAAWQEIDLEVKSSALKEISTEMAKQGRLEEALACARMIKTEDKKNHALEEISTELAKQDRFEDSLACALDISNDSDRSMALKEISIELFKLKRVDDSELVMNEAFKCARGISSDSDKSDALKGISTELAKQGNWSKAEQIGLEIPYISTRYICWQTIARDACKNQGWQKALSQAHQFRNPESCRYYRSYLAQMMNLGECHSRLLLNALPNYQEDVESKEIILYKHALNQMFFANAREEKINRFKRTLNIQWAIDIIKTLYDN